MAVLDFFFLVVIVFILWQLRIVVEVDASAGRGNNVKRGQMLSSRSLFSRSSLCLSLLEKVGKESSRAILSRKEKIAYHDYL
eukprot:6416421-Ditylum_brightwellii.AAC.1